MKTSISGHSARFPSPGSKWPAARRIVITALAVAPAFLAVGCTSPATELCEYYCECEGCTQSEYENCVGDGQAAVEEADQTGCSSQYDDYLSCVVEEAECRDDEHFDFDGCTLEEAALSECGATGASACEKSAEKFCDCQVSCQGAPPDDQCTDSLECEAKCVVEASCSDIINAPFGSDYVNCLQSC